MGTPWTFKVRVNDGPEEELAVKTSLYQHAAVAVPAILGYDDLPIHVEIWSPGLSRYHYIVRPDPVYGNIQAVVAVPDDRPPPQRHSHER